MSKPNIFRVSDAKLKEVVFVGPQIRELMKMKDTNLLPANLGAVSVNGFIKTYYIERSYTKGQKQYLQVFVGRFARNINKNMKSYGRRFINLV